MDCNPRSILRTTAGMLGSQLNQSQTDDENCKGVFNPNGKVEDALIDLSGRIDSLENLTHSLLNLIQYPQPVTSCDNALTQSDLTLVQRIHVFDSRVADANNTLAIAIDIIRQNLGSIKLD